MEERAGIAGIQPWTGELKNDMIKSYHFLFMPPKKTSQTVASDDIIGKNIFDILGLAGLPDDQKQPILQKMLQIVYQRVVARIMDVLPEDAMRQLKLAIDAEDEKTVTALLAQHGLQPFPEMMTEEAFCMKYEMDALVKGDAALRE